MHAGWRRLRKAYSYDKFDRLISSTGQGQLAATGYHYDALDRRDKKCAGPCTAATQTDLSYIGLTNALSSEQRGAATTGQAQAQSRSYDYDSQLDRLGTDWKTGTGSTQYRSFKTGPDGSVEGLEGGDGVVAANETYKYDPYGADMTDNTQAPGTPPAPPPAQSTSLDQAAQDNPFRFQGFYYDAGVKSYDMQAREYQPLIGRFTTPDRFESGGADYALAANPLTQDRYAFAAGNPVENIEADGHGAATGEGPNQPLRGGANRKRRVRRVARDQQKHADAQPPGHSGCRSEIGCGGSPSYSESPAYAHPGERTCVQGACSRQPVPGPLQARGRTASSVADQQGAQIQAAMSKPTPDEECNSVSCANPIRTPEREAEVARNDAQLVDILIGDPAHDPLDAITLLPTPLKELRVLRAADDVGDVAKAGDEAVKAGKGTPGREYGPFHRRPGRQTNEEMTKARNGTLDEVQGKTNSTGIEPSVDAHNGPLPPGQPGYEFYTPIRPRPGSAPGWAQWPRGYPGVRDINEDVVAIPCRVTRCQ